MEHKEIKLNELEIFGTTDNLKYVQMLVPEGWTSRINTFKDAYGGSKYPYQFTIAHEPADKTAGVYYYSPVNYTDDHLRNFADYQVDDFGFKYRKIKDMPTILDESVLSRFKEYNMQRIQHFPFASNDLISAQRHQGSITEAVRRGNAYNAHYYYGGINIYAYKYNNRDRIRMASAIVDGLDYCHWQDVQSPYALSMTGVNPSVVYPNYRYDENKGHYVYTDIFQYDWNFYRHIEMDVLKEDYEYAYKNIFVPIINHGVKICDDIWQDFRKENERLSKQRAARREDKKQAQQIRKQMQDNARKARNETYDYIRKTQQEIAAMRKNSYEKQKQSHERVMEQWTDTIRGNTRFVDKHGDEHVLHTYDDYAYKKGDSYITSDSSLDHFSDYEELEKKKY